MLSIIIALLVNLFIETSESFTVVVPGDPIETHVGSTVILPCWISPPENAEALEIRWYRHDQFSNPVLHYNHGKIQDIQEEPYRNRTSLTLRSDQSGGLKDGDVSLRLEKLRLQDEGPFRCYVSGDKEYDSQELLLKITALGSTPVLVPKPLDDGRVNISCRSSGWYPEPSVTWTSDDGSVLRPGGTSHSRGADGMFSVHSWTAVSQSDAQLVSCSMSIRTGEIKESRIDVQAVISPDVSSGPWKALFFTLLICALLGLVGLFLYKYRERLRGKNPAGECRLEEMVELTRADCAETMEKQTQTKEDCAGTMEKQTQTKEDCAETMEKQTQTKEDCAETMEKQTQTKEVVGDVNTEDQRKHADERDANIEEPRKHAVVGDVNTEDQRKHADERDANIEEPRKHADERAVNIEEPRKHADCGDESIENLINKVEKLNIEETRKHEVERDVNIEEPRKHAVLGDVNIEELRKHAVEIAIDREHLHPDLILSEDCKIVRDRPGYNHTGEGFPIQLCAFGAQRFTSGHHYWEVELTRDNKPPKNYWLIGVVKDGNFTARDRSGFTPYYGYWFVYSDGPNGFLTNTNPPVKLSLTPRPERLGVLLDYDDGQLSFYNVTERKHLLTISTRFSGSVVPLFNPGVGDQSELRILDCPKPAETPVESSQPLPSKSSDT